MERISWASENGDFLKLMNWDFGQLANFGNNARRTFEIFQMKESTKFGMKRVLRLLLSFYSR